ncbi:MFS transporter [Jonesiaceae bacterium BS-20]|uniref:MFS transporter n=1 Tax=Jonesiaceae bacterium BS-20 TaxID=3120821 RepID=A0AAU7DTL4_9MICO
MSTRSTLKSLLASPDFKRFFVIRLLCQSGDGLFQIALATLFFFSAQTQGSPQGIALALFVMLSPYTFVGPFVGVFLDRWQRRTVIVVSDAVRVVLTVALVAVLLLYGINLAVYVLALAALAINRLLLSALGASLPRVVDSDQLLLANSILPTIGAAATGVGALVGLLVGLVIPAGASRDAATLSLAIVIFIASIIAALGFDRTRLGPAPHELEGFDKPSVRQILHDLGASIRVVTELRTPAQALLSMAFMRLLYGMIFVSCILVSRNYFDAGPDGTGLGSFAQIIGFTALGFGVAIVLSPLVAGRFGEHAWIVITMVTCAIAQFIVAIDLNPFTLLITSFLLGVGTQGAKVSLDTIIQQDTPDEFRGRAFTLYDMLFNIAFMSAGGLCALFLPDTGVSVPMFAILGFGYLVIATGYLRPRRVSVGEVLPAAH